ncbi:hypothetical protein [Actinokineospora sp. HUAS TT18]|uniref:hypothetical protein n=1 Tax=Actinokineospora sp. HUAS TT18 TaxID=3447451 RepID=UPI003F521E69
MTSFALASDFVLRTARLLDRRRFEFLFGGGSAEAVLAALAPYRNADGGYGNALEPDGRGPGSQPVTVLTALNILYEVDATPDGVADYLESVTAPEGGVPFVHPNATDFPRAPWWEVPAEYTGSLLPTANLVGALWRAGVVHSWVDRAAEFCWPRIESLTDTHPYEALACVEFLDHAPDRDRAARAAESIGEIVRSRGLARVDGVATVPDGYAEGELHDPHDYAPSPDSLAYSWFTADEMAASLDNLEAAQGEDGGWRVRWPAWTPVVEFEWAGWMTVQALKTLRAHGREVR